jgi:hypothetical protein
MKRLSPPSLSFHQIRAKLDAVAAESELDLDLRLTEDDAIEKVEALRAVGVAARSSAVAAAPATDDGTKDGL